MPVDAVAVGVVVVLPARSRVTMAQAKPDMLPVLLVSALVASHRIPSRTVLGTVDGNSVDRECDSPPLGCHDASFGGLIGIASGLVGGLEGDDPGGVLLTGTAARTRVEVVIRKAVGVDLYVRLVGGKAQRALPTIVPCGVVVINQRRV
tara:strand:+ start:3117 stop:3563 length:447 start_codon:yes stop_codon:yes gene_type:complete